MESKKLTFPDGIIHFYEVMGEGTPIVFLHGNSLSSRIFSAQLNGNVLMDNRKIAFDFPGHGGSGKWLNPEESYSANRFMNLLLEIVERLSLHNAVFVGHSLGGHILLNVAHELPEASGFLFFGITPFTVPPSFEKAFLPNPAVNLLFKGGWSNEEEKKVSQSLVMKGGEVPFDLSESMRLADPRVRSCIAASIQSSLPTDETFLLRSLKKPVAMVHGMEDQLVNLEYLNTIEIPSLWESCIHKIEHAGHCPQIEQPAEFNNLIKKFVAYCKN